MLALLPMVRSLTDPKKTKEEITVAKEMAQPKGGREIREKNCLNYANYKLSGRRVFKILLYCPTSNKNFFKNASGSCFLCVSQGLILVLKTCQSNSPTQLIPGIIKEEFH